ncbi:MAG: hypothetical protein AAGI68_08750 [Planctomycetota bacterium]
MLSPVITSVLAVGCLVLAVGSGCSPAAPEIAARVVQNPDRSVGERVHAITQLGDTDRRLLHGLAWSEREADRVRIAAWQRLLEIAPDAWAMAELRLPRVRSMPMIEAVCVSLPAAERERMTPVLLRSLARRSWGGLAVADDDRPEWIGLGWSTREQRRVALRAWVLREGGPEVASESAWIVLCRWDGLASQRVWLRVEGARKGRVADPLGLPDQLIWASHFCDRLPQSFEELRWLDAVWQGSAARLRTPWVSSGFAVRHLPVFLADSDRLPGTMHGLLERYATRGGDDAAAGLDTPEPRSEEVPADEPMITVIVCLLNEPATQRVLFEQADADRDDASSEYGGVLVVPVRHDAAAAVPFDPLVRRDDHRYYPPPALFDRLLSSEGIAYYHFHAQSYDQAEFAGPGMGDLRVAARLGLTVVVFTFLDRDTLNVDVAFPGRTTNTMPKVVDLGSIKRPASP